MTAVQPVEAQIDWPWGVTVDATGNVYISVGNRIRQVDTSGTITTKAGTGSGGVFCL